MVFLLTLSFFFIKKCFLLKVIISLAAFFISNIFKYYLLYFTLYFFYFIKYSTSNFYFFLIFIVLIMFLFYKKNAFKFWKVKINVKLFFVVLTFLEAIINKLTLKTKGDRCILHSLAFCLQNALAPIVPLVP